MVLAVAVAIVVWLLLGRTVTGDWPSIQDSLHVADPLPVFPAARIAIPGAAIIAASPHLVRPARRFGRWMLVFGSFATISMQVSSLFGVLAGMLCAAAAAAIVHLIVGSSAGRPSLDDVRYALADLGVPITGLGVADRQDAGQFAVAATGNDGEELIVKVYGRDAYDAALLSTVQRTIWLRRPGSPVGFGRLRQVEHEAFLTLLARQEGIRTDTVVTAGVTATDDALLVLAPSGSDWSTRIGFTPETAVDERFAGPDGMDRIQRCGRSSTGCTRAVSPTASSTKTTSSCRTAAFGLIDFRGATVAADRRPTSMPTRCRRSSRRSCSQAGIAALPVSSRHRPATGWRHVCRTSNRPHSPPINVGWSVHSMSTSRVPQAAAMLSIRKATPASAASAIR